VTSVALVDADGDGAADDLVVGTVAGEPSLVYLGDGSGSFDGVEPLPIPDGGHVTQIVASDQDGDGEPDLILAHSDGPALVYLSDGGTDADQDGERDRPPGAFETALTTPLGAEGDVQPAVAALDHDADPTTPDVLVVGGANGPDLLWPSGAAHADDQALPIPGTEDLVTTAVGIGSVDGDDANRDVLLGTESGLLLLADLIDLSDPAALGDQAAPQTLHSAAVADIDVGDLDGDGIDDVAAVGDESTLVFVGADGGPTLQDELALPQGVDGRGVEIVDTDGDGVLDVLTSATDGQSLVYENDGETPLDLAAGMSPLAPPAFLSPPQTGGLCLQSRRKRR